jgi:predicted PurR-regulated permease PerM
MIATVDGWFAPEYRGDIRALGHEIHDTVAGFVRGQVVICLVLAVLYATALALTLRWISSGPIGRLSFLWAASSLSVKCLPTMCSRHT